MFEKPVTLFLIKCVNELVTFICKLVIAFVQVNKYKNVKYIKIGGLQLTVTPNNGFGKCVTMPTLSPQILLQQKDLAQDQREKIHLQVQLQQAGAGQLSIHWHGLCRWRPLLLNLNLSENHPFSLMYKVKQLLKCINLSYRFWCSTKCTAYPIRYKHSFPLPSIHAIRHPLS